MIANMMVTSKPTGMGYEKKRNIEIIINEDRENTDKFLTLFYTYHQNEGSVSLKWLMFHKNLVWRNAGIPVYRILERWLLFTEFHEFYSQVFEDIWRFFLWIIQDASEVLLLWVPDVHILCTRRYQLSFAAFKAYTWPVLRIKEYLLIVNQTKKGSRTFNLVQWSQSDLLFTVHLSPV